MKYLKHLTANSWKQWLIPESNGLYLPALGECLFLFCNWFIDHSSLETIKRSSARVDEMCEFST